MCVFSSGWGEPDHGEVPLWLQPPETELAQLELGQLELGQLELVLLLMTEIL